LKPELCDRVPGAICVNTEGSPELCDRVPGAICVNTEGSFDCKCKEENQRIEDGQCIDIVETG